MKVTILVVCYLIFAGFAFGQKVSPCSLTIKNAPEIRSLKLGMSRKSFNEVLSSNDNGDVSVFDEFQLGRRKGFENVDSLIGYFYEDKLFGFSITYKSDSSDWSGNTEFAKNLSANLKLPFNAWNFRQPKADEAKMICAEFEIKISASHRYIHFSDLIASEKMRTEQENKNKNFKP